MMEWKDLSGVSDAEDVDTEERAVVITQKGRRNIRHIKDLEDLQLETRIANRNEKERISRLESLEKKFKEELSGLNQEDKLILAYDFINKVPLVSVHQDLVRKMKSHQKEGVKFMWNACFESLEQIQKSEGSGCIIAHCMGLGKTFQVVALIHTLLNYKQIGTKNILICCPKNTLMNWINEFQMWITSDLGCIDIYNPTRFENISARKEEIGKWHRNGGVCVINYELMRVLLEDDKKKENLKFHEYLCNPGPDLIVCDEGHVLKNEETKLSKVMSRIRTMRRIVLTGTPMQNNLKEYHCMIQFVKPNLLGTLKEFVNMFVNPILNGQYENSSEEDVQLMKERSHILHKKLLGCVQRFDLTTLNSYLPEKHEYVISVALTDSQIKMYKFYLANYSAKGDPHWRNDGVALFADYQSLQRIWTHPYTLKMYAEKHEGGRKKSKKKKKSYAEESEDESTDSETFRWNRFPPFWWLRFVTSDDLDDLRQSNKLLVLFQILRECEQANEKLLVFSGSLYSLQLIQHFLKRIHTRSFDDPSLCNLSSMWEEELDYLVLTGQTSAEDRHNYCRSFNDVSDTRLRLFLISTKAGGMGINLTAANRAVLFDVSWNPSHDIQSIFRIYRIGQKKSCFVYRLVASGTMEEKIYERQVAKESISYRVVDEKQIARHYTQRELLELYMFVPVREQKTREVEVKDGVVRKIFEEGREGGIVGVHEHDSLLEHKEEEELQELEKNHAWTAYNQEDKLETLPEAERLMLSRLTPDSFDPSYFKKVLERKHPESRDEEISLMMTQLLPKVEELLQRPDFLDLMKKQALYYHNRSCKSSKMVKNKRTSLGSKTKRREETGNGTIDLVDTPEGDPKYGESENSSGSEDSIFRCNVSRKKRKIKPMKREEKQLENALDAIMQRVADLKTSIAAMIFKIENEYETINWPTFLDNFALLSGHLTTLSKMLSLDKTPPLRNLTVLPLMLSPERDEDLLRATENRIPAFTHDLVPDYLRTKPDPEVEQKMIQLEVKAANLSNETAQKQVAAYTKVVNHIYDIVSKAREEWETETSSRAGVTQTSSMADTHALVAAVGIGKGLKPMQGAPPGMMVAPVGPGRPPGSSQQTQQMGPMGGKAPSTIKTNIKSGASIHPYGR